MTEEGGDAPAAGAGDAAGVKTEGKGDDAEDGGGGGDGEDDGDGGGSSVSSDLQAELAGMKKDQKGGGFANERLRPINSGVKGVLLFMIKDETIDPVGLVIGILKDLAETRVNKSRFCIRMIPLQVKCTDRERGESERKTEREAERERERERRWKTVRA